MRDHRLTGHGKQSFSPSVQLSVEEHVTGSSDTHNYKTLVASWEARLLVMVSIMKYIYMESSLVTQTPLFFKPSIETQHLMWQEKKQAPVISQQSPTVSRQPLAASCQMRICEDHSCKVFFFRTMKHGECCQKNLVRAIMFRVSHFYCSGSFMTPLLYIFDTIDFSEWVVITYVL